MKVRMRTLYTVLGVLALSFSFASVPPAAQSQAANRRVVRKVEPQYPVPAKRMNLGGTVKVIAVVAPDGTVKKVEPVGGSPILVEAAATAISQWKYEPGSESRENIELHFTP